MVEKTWVGASQAGGAEFVLLAPLELPLLEPPSER
jgi:hypothetical protein